MIVHIDKDGLSAAVRDLERSHNVQATSLITPILVMSIARPPKQVTCLSTKILKMYNDFDTQTRTI